MEGMATKAEMARLSAERPDADTYFLQLMLATTRAGIT